MGTRKKMTPSLMARRFRGFMPVVVDVETAGFNPQTDALLEIAIATLRINEQACWQIDTIITKYIQPFEGANLDQASLEFTGIDINHPFRKQIVLPEKQAIQSLFDTVNEKKQEHGCKQAILVGHNAAFDLAFLNAAIKRIKIKKNPFHSFSSFDTATLAGLAYGQTVLSRAVMAAGMEWDSSQAHSACYDVERTAELFCRIVNHWSRIASNPPSKTL